MSEFPETPAQRWRREMREVATNAGRARLCLDYALNHPEFFSVRELVGQAQAYSVLALIEDKETA